MAIYGSPALAQLSSVLDDVCRNLQDENGEPVSTDVRNALARKIFQVLDLGVTNKTELERVLLDFAASRQSWMGRRTAALQTACMQSSEFGCLEKV